MVADFSPGANVVLVGTKSNDSPLDDEDVNVIKCFFENLRFVDDYYPVESSDGTGIEALKETLVKLANYLDFSLDSLLSGSKISESPETRVEKLKKLNEEISALEKTLDKNAMPYTPGRLPELK